jgi:hypothetical protein
MPEQTGTQLLFFCFSGTKVQILTETGLPAGAADSAAAGLNIEGLFDTGSTCIELPDSVGNAD